MMSDQAIEVIINKTINAPASTVFEAWTQPELIKRWFVPNDSMSIVNAEVNLAVGGNYLIHMKDHEKNSEHIVSGTYEEIIPNEKIVFNWMWKDGVDRTQVTIEINATTENETLLTLSHRGFSQQEFADNHNKGWTGCLATLSNMLTESATA
jgi:uncharacterized protein YndB with AHSA1/START domain